MTTSESAGVPVDQSAAEIPAQRAPAETEAGDRQQRAPAEPEAADRQQRAPAEPEAGDRQQRAPAGAEASDSEPARQATPNAVDAGKPETAPLTGRVVAPADDPRQLEAEIERTRAELGETVQELAARVDVKSRARAKATQLSGRVKTSTVQARKNAVARAGSVRTQVAGKTGGARQKAISAGAGGRDQLRNRAAAVGAPVWQATPEPVRRTVTKGAKSARERWIPLAAAAGVFIVGYLAIRQWSKRSSAPDQAGEAGSARQVRQRIRRSPAPDQADDAGSARQVWILTRRSAVPDQTIEPGSARQVRLVTRRSPAPDQTDEAEPAGQDCSVHS
jgi:hypothetical protein